FFIFFFQAEDGIRDRNVTGVQTCALPISSITSAKRAAHPNEPSGSSKGRTRSGRACSATSPYGCRASWRLSTKSRRRTTIRAARSEERRVGKECRSRWTPSEESREGERGE